LAARIDYKASVARDLEKLGQTAAGRILRKVERVLASEGHQGEALSGEFAGLYRLQVGDYRVIYARTDEGYLVLRIGHCRDVYRKGRPGIS
jgi:mRNA interferase RelE/StbE